MKMQTRKGTVIGRNGLRGTFDLPEASLTPITDSVRVQLDNGLQISVPASLLAEQTDGVFHIPLSYTELERAGAIEPDNVSMETAASSSGDGSLVIPVVAETMDVRKRTVETGKVRITKTVQQHEETIDEPFYREEIEIHRVPVNRIIEQPLEIRQEEDTTIIPVMEEILTVEKRLILREELHVVKKRSEIREPQTVPLRKEEVTVERISSRS